MESTRKNLARNLYTWREKNGVKMEVAARELGVSTATWGHWETGKRFPALQHLSCLSQYMQVPICRLICFNSGKCNDCRENNVGDS